MTPNTEPRTIQDLMKDILARVPAAATERKKAVFVQATGVCETHGEYPENALVNGVERWNQPGCPTCRKQEHARALIANSDISQRFMRCTFENYRVDIEQQAHALRKCQRYAENFKDHLAHGRCMVMRGNPGTGKNHLSSAIMMEIIQNGFTAMRIKASAFLDEYWSKSFSEREPWMKRMASVDLLVIDEIGRASNGKSANDAFFRLIDMRYEAMKPTAVISNLETPELKATLGEAAYDRLREDGGVYVEFDWVSGRGRRRDEE